MQSLIAAAREFQKVDSPEGMLCGGTNAVLQNIRQQGVPNVQRTMGLIGTAALPCTSEAEHRARRDT
jgi:hypothetical protein